MKNALEAYRALLIELDKYESPTFTVGDFNHFYNSAIDEYIVKNYIDFDLTQKSLDDIRVLLETQDLTFTDNKVDLEEDYRHVITLESVLEFSEDVRGYKKGDKITTYPKRLKTNQKGFRSKNAYLQPSYFEPYFQITGSQLTILAGDSVSGVSGKLEYIKNADTVYLNPDKSADFSKSENNSLLEFPLHVNYEILKICRRMFLENIESPRYQTNLYESKMTN